jgi:hypothetical protein
MSQPRYARLASKVLVEQGEARDVPPSPEARAAAITAVTAALTARRRARRAARWAAGAATAAAAVGAAIGVARWAPRHATRAAIAPLGAPSGVQIVAQSVGDGASVVVSGAEAPLAAGRTIPEGSRLVTPADGRATLAFSTGTSVTLGEGTELTVGGEGQKQRLELGAGWVDLHVAKLAPNARFIVDTSDSEVEVRGTRFRVSVAHPDPACGGGTATRVAVTEGVVVVRHDGAEVRVAAGEEWPQGCAKAAAGSPGASGAAPATGVAAGHTYTPSPLPEQNRLYTKAIAAKNRGDARGAVALFDQYLAKYPDGQNAEDAAVERMHLLRTTAPARAVTAAHQYLGAHPNGWAREEAEAIVAGGP